MTRAILSLVRLDFTSYLYYNAMAIFVLSDIVLVFFEKRTKHKRLLYAYLIVTLFCNLIYYAHRLASGTIL